jgi:2-polyprenyl-3-methyl-5-hydroxy-6-metoxy-1,4-benzoquinol methylase
MAFITVYECKKLGYIVGKKDENMSSKVQYSKQTLDTPNPIARFAHKARYKFSLVKTLEYLGNNGILLDFGCGDGSFLNRLAMVRSDAVLYGFDPEADQNSGPYERIDTLNDLGNQSVDMVCCLETLEHLYANEREHFYADVRRILANNGKVVVSVPIIGGPTLLLKELNRMILFKRRSEYSFKELLSAAFLGKPAPKPENPRITHKGFNFRDIEEELSNKFEMVEKIKSPFPLLPWFLNSQFFFVLSI